MTSDSLDTFIRTSTPPVDISDERLETLIEATLFKTEQYAGDTILYVDDVTGKESFWNRISALLMPQPVWRYAVSMCVATVLGVLAGASLPGTSTITDLSGNAFIVSFSTTLAGF